MRHWFAGAWLFCLALTLLWVNVPTLAQEAAPTPAASPAPTPAAETIAEAAAGDPQPVKATAEPPRQRRAAIPATPTEIVRQLGWFVIPFVVASVIALWFSIERLVVLRSSRVIPRPFVERFLQLLQQGKLDAETALRLCDQNPSPVAAVFAHGIRKWGKPSVEVEQAIIDGGERQVSHLRKHLRVLNGVATVAPLLGLLGTVIGMIQAFNEIANSDAMGKAEELAVGIALALLTTAAGLVIAIPSLILYMYLSGRVDTLVIEMDAMAQDVVHQISAEGLTEQAHRAHSARKRPTPAEEPLESA